MRAKNITLILLLALPMVGCDWFSSDGKTPIIEDEVCNLGPPFTLNATASKSGCDASSCRAQFNVDPTGARLRWRFPNGTPRESPEPSVEATFERPASFPATFGYDVLVCSCSAKADPMNQSCRLFNGSVTFVTATDRSTSGQQADLRIEVGAAIDALAELDYETAEAMLLATAASTGLDRSWHFRDRMAAVNLSESEMVNGFRRAGALADYMSGAIGGSCWRAACADDSRQTRPDYGAKGC
jgi:hypothetical protein